MKEVRYGIYNTMRKEFQFGINASSKGEAYKQLRKKIGDGARKWRFEVRPLPKGCD